MKERRIFQNRQRLTTSFIIRNTKGKGFMCSEQPTIYPCRKCGKKRMLVAANSLFLHNPDGKSVVFQACTTSFISFFCIVLAAIDSSGAWLKA